MVVLKRLLSYSFLVIVLGIKIANAQGEAAVPFLLLAPDSRAGGMGESGAGLADNSAAIFWNPAGIGFLDGTELSITHSNWLPQFHLDLFYDYLTFRHYIPAIGGSITASITYMNYGEFVWTGETDPTPLGTFRSFDAALTVGYATKLSQSFAVGGNFRVIHSRLADKPVGLQKEKGIATTVSFDLAAMWRPVSLPIPLLGNAGGKFSVGANLSNLGPKIYYINQAQADPIPTNFRLGFAFRLLDIDYNSITMTADFSKLLVKRDSVSTHEFYQAIFSSWSSKSAFREIVSSAGLEYWYGKQGDFQFALRAGIFYEDPSYGARKFVSLGAGLRYDMYGFDFSYITTSVFPGGENHPLNETLRFTLSLGWGSNVKPKPGLPRGI
ncbi:MAG: PorV/PorQ family protein [Ignavibacteria bacterium]|nr:PorV/PorQ family protein [Ignavibacteria bacterium]